MTSPVLPLRRVKRCQVYVAVVLEAKYKRLPQSLMLPNHPFDRVAPLREYSPMDKVKASCV